jgi:hypothetical protein
MISQRRFRQYHYQRPASEFEIQVLCVRVCACGRACNWRGSEGARSSTWCKERCKGVGPALFPDDCVSLTTVCLCACVSPVLVFVCVCVRVTGLGEEGAWSSTWCRALAPPSSPPVPLPPALPSRYFHAVVLPLLLPLALPVPLPLPQFLLLCLFVSLSLTFNVNDGSVISR